MIMKQSSCAKKGFTLIELLVVISIIGILATIVIGPMNSFLDGASQDAAKPVSYTHLTLPTIA